MMKYYVTLQTDSVDGYVMTWKVVHYILSNEKSRSQNSTGSRVLFLEIRKR